MRVLLLNNNIPGHGAWFRAVHAAHFFHRRGHDVTLVSTGRNLYRARFGHRNGIKLWRTPSWSPFLSLEYGWSVPGLLWRLGIAVSRRWDLVWAFSHKPVDQFPARLARQIHGATWLTDWCDLWSGRQGISRLHWRRDGNPLIEAIRSFVFMGDDRLERTAAMDCDGLTVISDDLKNRADALGRDKRSALLRNGCDLKTIRPLDRTECRQILGIPPEQPVAGYVSNYQPDEDFLLDALASARDRMPEARFLLRCPYFREGIDALESRGLEEAVQWFDRVSQRQLQVIMGACNLLLVPMEDNAFNRSRMPHKISDYMATGRAQLACAVGDVPELLRQHGVGETCEPDARVFGGNIAKLLSSPEKCDEYGVNGRRAAESDFQWNSLIVSVLTHLEIDF